MDTIRSIKKAENPNYKEEGAPCQTRSGLRVLRKLDRGTTGSPSSRELFLELALGRRPGAFAAWSWRDFIVAAPAL